MSVYAEGKPITPGAKVDPNKLQANKEYIFEYQAPKVAFSLIGPETLSALVKSWVNFRAKFLEEEGAVFEITGVRIDTGTGKIWVRGTVTPPKTVTVNGEVRQVAEAGVNPKVIFAAVAFIFGAIGVGVSLLFVYEVGSEVLGFGGDGDGPQIDPCTETGVTAYIKCLARRTGWVALGLGAGVLVTLAIMLVLVGRRERYL